MINLDIEIGDEILTGRFKNKRIEVKDIGEDEYGTPTINGRPILKFRVAKWFETQPNIFEEGDNKMTKKQLRKLIKEEIQKIKENVDLESLDLKKIERGIDASYVDSRYSTNLVPDITIRVSLDEKKDWDNGYFANSRYGIFMINEDGVLENLSKHYSLKKTFRKTRVKNEQDVINKINKWISQVK